MAMIKRVIPSLIFLLLLSACSPDGTQGQIPILPRDSGDKNLSVFLIQNDRVTDLRDNHVTRIIEETLDIKLDIYSSLEEDVALRKEMMFYSNKYPEVFLSGRFTPEEIVLYGIKEERLLPLNQFILEDTTYLKKNYYNPKLFPHIMTPNGFIYALPRVNEDTTMNHRLMMWINSKWLEELDLAVPETTDDFHNVLKAFYSSDPNGNGKADEIPLSGSNNGFVNNPVHFIMNAFVYDDGWSYLRLSNNQLDFVPTLPEWREGLRFINTLYRDNLLDINCFYQSSYHLKMNIKNDSALVYGAVADSELAGSIFIDNSMLRHSFYTALPPLMGPEGTQCSPYFGEVDHVYDFAITDRCLNPEKAMELADFLASPEGSFLSVHGPEGISWTRNGDNSLLSLDSKGRDASYFSLIPPLNQGNHLWGSSHFCYISLGMVDRWAVSEDPNDQEAYYMRKVQEAQLYSQYEKSEAIPPLFIKSSLIAEVMKTGQEINDYVEKSMIRFITGDLDIEEDWDAYLDELNHLGMVKYLQIYRDTFINR